jgi:hypothetical protein
MTLRRGAKSGSEVSFFVFLPDGSYSLPSHLGWKEVKRGEGKIKDEGGLCLKSLTQPKENEIPDLFLLAHLKVPNFSNCKIHPLHPVLFPCFPFHGRMYVCTVHSF